MLNLLWDPRPNPIFTLGRSSKHFYWSKMVTWLEAANQNDIILVWRKFRLIFLWDWVPVRVLAKLQTLFITSYSSSNKYISAFTVNYWLPPDSFSLAHTVIPANLSPPPPVWAATLLHICSCSNGHFYGFDFDFDVLRPFSQLLSVPFRLLWFEAAVFQQNKHGKGV